MCGVVGDVDGLVDQQHGDPVIDAVRTAKPGVVEEFVADEQQGSAVLRADQDVEQFLVEGHGDQPAGTGMAGACVTGMPAMEPPLAAACCAARACILRWWVIVSLSASTSGV